MNVARFMAIMGALALAIGTAAVVGAVLAHDALSAAITGIVFGQFAQENARGIGRWLRSRR